MPEEATQDTSSDQPAATGPYDARTAGEAYAGDRPLCFCHQEPMTWGRTGRLKAGGSWRCAIRAREAVQRTRQKARAALTPETEEALAELA